MNPVLVANTSIDDDKIRRVRGLLSDIDIADQTFIVNIRPFRIRHQSYGEITVHTNEETLYEINATSYGSDGGLDELAKLDTLSPIV